MVIILASWLFFMSGEIRITTDDAKLFQIAIIMFSLFYSLSLNCCIPAFFIAQKEYSNRKAIISLLLVIFALLLFLMPFAIFLLPGMMQHIVDWVIM
jgi:hypothetical protein